MVENGREWVCATPMPAPILKVYPIRYSGAYQPCVSIQIHHATNMPGMVLALCTGCPHAYPQFYGLVVIMYVIGHSLCYPMGYDLPSPSLAQSLHPAYAMPPPAIGAPCRPTWCGLSPGSTRQKQKGPIWATQHMDKRA